MKLTSAKISKAKNDILQKVGLERNELKSTNKKLKYYRYVENYLIYITAVLDDIFKGSR